jgi:uncharacterized membrane protein
MLFLVWGLVIFLGTHSIRVTGDGLRDQLVQSIGPARFKAIYALSSLLGFALLVYGFGIARDMPVVLWTPPPAMKHLAYLLTLLAMVLMAAVYVPHNVIKSKLHHPMVLSVKVWALAHVLANGTLAHVVLFGSMLMWSVVLFKASRARDKRNQVVYAAGNKGATILTIEIGIAMWLVFIGWAHGWLIGVQVM